MKVDHAINYLVLDLLKKILSMAEKPAELGKYITNQIRELVGCKMVILLLHNDDNQNSHHQLLGICPERKINEINLNDWNAIAEVSHGFHGVSVIQHQKSGNEMERLLSQTPGEFSILVPLEYIDQRVGLLAVIDVYDINNIQSIIDSLDALSGVLAIELRNATVMQNLEEMVVRRTKELTESEKRFRTIIEQATDAIFLSDMEGNIVDTNQQASKSLGYSRNELLKLNITDLDARFNEPQKVIEAFEKMKPEESFTFESIHRHKNGTEFPVEISTSLIDLNGSNMVLGFVRDISERKQNEQKIIRMGLHYQALIDKAPDGIVLISADGNFKFISPSARQMFGYANTDEITGNPAQFTHPDDLPAVLSLLQNLMQNPSEVSTLQYRFCDKEGNWRWVESTFSNLLADPSVEAIVINFRDITDRKIAAEEIRELNDALEQKVIERTNELGNRTRELSDNQKALLNLVEDLNEKSEELTKKTELLQAANKELEAFSYSVSHDLRAPLRAVNGFVKILQEEYGEKLDDEGKRLCKIIELNALKMGQLIDDLLSFSRLIRSEIRQSSVDMGSIVHQVFTDLKADFQNKKISFTMGALPSVICDQNMIRQVWTNLISNALKYSSRNEEINITIGATRNENEVIYFIRDNGIGFDMQYSHKLFGVFQRLHNLTEFEGTGVGLAIVQRIVHRHNGKIWAEGSVGNGATFYFTLPEN